MLMEGDMAYITDFSVSRAAFGFGVLKTIGLWMQAARERRALKALGYSRLEDLGIDPAAADAEASRPFWSVRRRG